MKTIFLFSFAFLYSCQLQVLGGKGSGNYTAGEKVTISAQEEKLNTIFESWSGGDEFIEDIYSRITRLTMPNKNLVVVAQTKELDFSDFQFDVFLVMGQSNTHSGYPFDSVLDAEDYDVFQLGRAQEYDFKLIRAQEPLHHHHRDNSKIGFALNFAKQYKANALESDRKILIIPCGKGSTGFKTGDWNPGNALYIDAVKRINFVLNKNPANELKAFLWHQGETDVGNPDHAKNLDSMIRSLRNDVVDASEVPFILGGMVEAWVNEDNTRKKHQQILQGTPSRVKNSAFVSSKGLGWSSEPNGDVKIHFSAASQRELGLRYWKEYDKLVHK